MSDADVLGDEEDGGDVTARRWTTTSLGWNGGAVRMARTAAGDADRRPGWSGGRTSMDPPGRSGGAVRTAWTVAGDADRRSGCSGRWPGEEGP